MPLTYKEEKTSIKTRKPLSSSVNTRDSISKKQKSYSKKDHLKQHHQKLINRSTINSKTFHVQEQEKSIKKKHSNKFEEEINIKQSQQQKQISYKTTQLPLQVHQTPIKLKQSWSKLKQSVKQVYFYDKYSKKDIVNISIIEQKSLLSNNQQNSLDSLNNFIIQGNDKSLLEKSHESSSFDDEQEDWILMQKEYQEMIEQSYQNLKENEYLRIIGLFERDQIENEQISDQNESPFISINNQIQRLKGQIKRLRQIKNSKQSMVEVSSQVINQIMSENEQNQKEVLQERGVNSGSSQNMKKYDGSSKEQISIGLQKQAGSRIFESDKSLGLEIQIQGQVEKMKMIIEVQQKQKILGNVEYKVIEKKSDIDLLKQEKKNNKQLQKQKQQQEQQQQQKSQIIEQQQQFQNQSTLQDEKSQQEFIRYMDNEYLQKKQSQDNQPNLSLNNISNIMRIKPIELHNKSIQNQHEIKEKQDDQVVAMLQNQLRGKQSKLKTKKNQNTTNIQPNNNHFLKQQENLFELKQQEQQNILKQDNQIILKDDNEIILMKQSPDNLQLNESDYQTNLQTQLSNDQNNNFFFALNARQKWIESLQKDHQWKQNQLALIAKMKKILHNPYIQFQDY